ncbi:MAG: LysR family transcriptional regulator, partial [Eubacteriales bacterium]|nr:LysR family transcriptional regulator [Eubacteriales bacterium]
DKEPLTPEDIKSKPLILSRQMYKSDDIPNLLQTEERDLHVTGTYNLLYNGSIMVEKGMGYAICYDKIINTSGNNLLKFTPLAVDSYPSPIIVWKKYQVFSKASQKFKEELMRRFSTDK